MQPLSKIVASRCNPIKDRCCKCNHIHNHGSEKQPHEKSCFRGATLVRLLVPRCSPIEDRDAGVWRYQGWWSANSTLSNIAVLRYNIAENRGSDVQLTCPIFALQPITFCKILRVGFQIAIPTLQACQLRRSFFHRSSETTSAPRRSAW